jgi:hypothetical protein
MMAIVREGPTMNARVRRNLVTRLSTLVLLLAAGIAGAAEEPGEKNEDGDDLIAFVKGAPVGQVEPGRALVYVLRPAKMGYGVKSWFFCDEEVLGANKGDSCFAAQVEPGAHVFWSKSENVDAVELTVEAGSTYFIQQRVQVGGFKARTKLDVLTAEEGPTILAKCNRQSSLTESGRARGAELAAEYRKATEEDLERRARKAQQENPGE